MDNIKIRIFDRLRVDVAHAGRQVTGFFFHFVQEGDGLPHVSVFTEPNPSGRDQGLFTPHFTRWFGAFRRTLARVAPASLRKLLDDFARELMPQFVAALSPVDMAEIESEGWRIIELSDEAFTRWIELIKRDGQYVIDDDSITQGMELLVEYGTEHLPTTYSLANAPRRPLWALREVASGFESMQLVGFPDGCGVRNDDGSVSCARPPGWYRLAENWWPRTTSDEFFERRVGVQGRKLEARLQAHLDGSSHRPWRANARR